MTLSLLGPDDRVRWEEKTGPATELTGSAVETILNGVATAGGAAAVGHRFVRGGPDLAAPVLIDTAVEEELRARANLAPLHMPAALALHVYLHRSRGQIATMTAALGGLDALVFTGGGAIWRLHRIRPRLDGPPTCSARCVLRRCATRFDRGPRPSGPWDLAKELPPSGRMA